MVKGFIFFKEGKIPFVIKNCRMELFTDDSLLNDFTKEYNFKLNYTLKGQCFGYGFQGQDATFLVEESTGSTCNLRCFIINMIAAEDGYDAIGLQSPFLDDVFRYRYNYIDMVRAGTNFSVEPIVVHNIPFSMQGRQYELSFRIGYDNRLGLLEDYDKKGEILIPLQANTIQECFDISVVLYRLAMFMASNAEVSFKRITLYRNGSKACWFYSPLVSENAVSGNDGFFCEFDVMKYVPKVLNNIALDSGNRITHSMPLGHLGNFDTMFSPQRFVEQVMAFEYLFDKLEHQKAQNKYYPLKDELRYSFNMFPELLLDSNLSADVVSEKIKELRRTIAHGYAYYYDFKGDPQTKYLMILLDKLIKAMSLKQIGFSGEDIRNYTVL